MKNFDRWNINKKKINSRTRRLHAKAREVWSVNLGVNIGDEQDGKWPRSLRPVLVVKNVGAMLFVVPMTTSGRESKFYYTLPEHYFWKTSRLILSQAKHIDRKRLEYRMGKITPEDFKDIKKRLRDLIL